MDELAMQLKVLEALIKVGELLGFNFFFVMKKK
jgi:hypothetical protein